MNTTANPYAFTPTSAQIAKAAEAHEFFKALDTATKEKIEVQLSVLELSPAAQKFIDMLVIENGTPFVGMEVKDYQAKLVFEFRNRYVK